MKLSYRIAFAIILILFAEKTLFAQPGTLTGTVRSGFEFLQSATVSIANQTSTTDQRGQFSLSLNPGTYLIAITHAGYKTIETSITIVAGRENNVEFNMIPNGLLDAVTIMGSKTGTERSNLFTGVPVDVVSSSRLMQTGQPILIQMLNYSLPSFNAERQRYDEPVTYRGMDPDHLLILFNNIRYHNSAWLNTGNPKANLGRGSVINDLNSIPSIAIDKVEVLRDGASAQYGSDAIAGVMNFRLKESTGRLLINANFGQFYAGDGFKSWLGIYRGFRLTKKKLSAEKQGFISLAAEFRTQAPTTRVGEYAGLVYENYPPNASFIDSTIVKAKDDSLIKANGLNRRDFNRNSEKTKLISGLLVNGSYPFSNRIKLFWTGTLNYKSAPSSGSYRYPNVPAQVNRFLYPNGFKPYYKTINWDATAIAGIKGITKNYWNWELSSSFGNNTNTNDVYNSNNASQESTLGADAPTSFYLGKMVYKLFTNNISFAKDLSRKNNNGWSSKIIMGAEWRLENYKLKEGDEAATIDYDSAGPKQGGSQPSSGSVGIRDAINKNRSASSVYANLELEPNDHFLIDIASRYEYFSDFGSNLAGKLAIRYKFSPKLSIRGSVSNGYRAPALQQRYFSGIQNFRGTTGQTVRVFNNESNITRAFHIPSLTAERALNLSSGITSRLSRSVSFTLDGYIIQLKNRIIVSGVFDRAKDPQIDRILIDYAGINLVQFYTNAINTRTYGVDAVLNGNWTIQTTNIGLTLAANVNRHAVFGGINPPHVVTDISNYSKILFGVQERTTLKRDQPGEKVILSAVVNKGKFGFVLRNTFFGSTASTTIYTTPIVDTVYEFFSSRILTDCSINYTPKPWLTITVGANNIFNVYPDRQIRNNEYSNGSIPYGANGGYYYLNMSFNF